MAGATIPPQYHTVLEILFGNLNLVVAEVVMWVVLGQTQPVIVLANEAKFEERRSSAERKNSENQSSPEKARASMSQGQRDLVNFIAGPFSVLYSGA